MEKQKPVILNLTKQETECIDLVLKDFRENYYIKTKEMKPCYPFLDRLQAKINTALNKSKS